MSDEFFEDMLIQYDNQVLKFYCSAFENEQEAKSFVNRVYAYCSVDRGPALQMLYQVERFVSLADDIDKLRPARDGLRILFYKTCLESLQFLSGKKKDFYDAFADCFSEEAQNYILSRFVFTGYNEDNSSDSDVNLTYRLNINNFLMIIKAIRDMVVHEGNYWENQVFAQDDDSIWCVHLITNEKILNDDFYKDKEKTQIYYFETTLQYEKFRHYFIVACVNYINNYIEKTGE